MQNIYLLHQGVEKAAEETPTHPAVRFNQEEQTYQQLNTLKNQLAHALISCGVKRGDRVGIFMYKNLNSAAALYGIMSAGAAYVPLDPFAPLPRLAYVIQNCSINVLITHEKKSQDMAELIQLSGVQHIIGLEDRTVEGVHTIPWAKLDQFPANPPHLMLTEQDMAYILYTSGSTGMPKGIVHTHRSGLSFALWAAETYQLISQDRLSNHAPLHFDLSTFDFFAASQVGATTCIIPEGVTKFPASMAKWIQDERISVWYSVPFALIQMLQRANLPTKDYSALRWILFAGEPFPTKHLRDVMKILPGVKFSNLYGPTETNVCTYYHVPVIAEDQDDPISIGIACGNVEDMVVDENSQPVPQGSVGELLIRGGVVMRGYWARPDLTERGFYQRTVTEQFEDTFYRTGDLVQKMEDGNYRFLGRKDRQIKTRGYRVELDEIETALLAHEMVEEAAVYPVPDGEGSNLIEAAVIPKIDLPVTTEMLYEVLALKLPPYALPSQIHLRADFPRTSTGKINRRELQEMAAKKET
jgi:amino acid adenylation domain-containing protein